MENLNITEELKNGSHRALLVSVSTTETTEECMRSLDELARLLETAGGEEAARIIQNRVSPDKATYVGSGKVKEIAEFIEADGDISLIVFDNELTPSQIANLEKEIPNARVIDRTMLILDIFALHAVTGEGKLQVEIACLRYTAPRLTGRGKDLSRLGGGIGTRGPGESKLESDRRHIKRRIAALSEEIADIERTRSVKRASRARSGIKSAAIIGYTNAGKSTLLNTLTDAGILAEDKLFATLDPTTRRLALPSGAEMLLTDTVGFIDRLPTHLVKAFKSTLEELKYADYIIVITDASEEFTERERKREVTKQLIEELGAGDKPLIEVFNKCDIVYGDAPFPSGSIEISAKSGMGTDALLQRLDELVSNGKRKLKLLVPHSEGGVVSDIYRLATVLECEYIAEGALIFAECDARAQGTFEKYIVE
ncbi:MAG: GTPase HflX [Clostridia bacterium]|nr:GTPase HflX [Clostridia bacterium]MBQ9848425.1 GTPase HflX [Clostridia bacterium]